MSFTLAALIVVAAAAIALGLMCYHLLTRVHLLERAVHGGLEPPTRRLTREEFERRFAVASARSELARRFDTGLVFFVGAESDRDHEVVRALQQLPRPDLVHVISRGQDQPLLVTNGLDVVTVDDLGVDADHLGVATTPFAFVLDQQRVRAARPVSGSGDVTALLREYT